MLRILLLLALTLLLAQADCTNTKKSANSVCDSWTLTDKATLDKAVDRFARSLDPKRPMNENARVLADWLEKQPCIKQVIVPSTIIQTFPPGLDIAVTHNDGSKRSFSMLFSNENVRLSYSYP